MNFKPMSDDEIESSGLFVPGDYSAEVKECTEYVGKESGKTSLKTIFTVYDGDRTAEVWAFLTPAYAKLWKHAIYAMIDQQTYESGQINASDFVGKSCVVKIGHEEYNGKKKHTIIDIERSRCGQLPIDSSLPF